MKNKTVSILTVISCLFILSTGVSNLLIQIRMPKFFNYRNIASVSLFSNPMLRASAYILLAVLCITKMLCKNKTVLRVLSALLGVSALLYLITETFNFILYVRFTPHLLLGEIAADYVFAVILIICINTFKPFLSNKAALIISLSAAPFGLIAASLNTHFYYYVNIRFAINDLLADKLFYLSFFAVSYRLLKPEKANTAKEIAADCLK